MQKGFSLPTILLMLCSCRFTNAMDNITKEEIAMTHYDINPELVENLRLMVRMDRHALKTILENQAALFETLLVSTILQAYNASTKAAYCVTQAERSHRKSLVDKKNQIAGIIDKSLDEMYKKWEELETQADLEAYFMKYWDDRDALYNYVSQSNPGGICDDSEVAGHTCSAVESLHASYYKAVVAMSQCKLSLSSSVVDIKSEPVVIN